MSAAGPVCFSGHETFPFRYPWLKKGFDAVKDDGEVFQREDAITTLGVGKNMVRSIRHWCLAAGVVEEDRDNATRRGGLLRPTLLGQRLLGDDGLDPYLEDPATLWLLHWQIASNRGQATTWHWTFSHFNEPEFTRESLALAQLPAVDFRAAKLAGADGISYAAGIRDPRDHQHAATAERPPGDEQRSRGRFHDSLQRSLRAGESTPAHSPVPRRRHLRRESLC